MFSVKHFILVKAKLIGLNVGNLHSENLMEGVWRTVRHRLDDPINLCQASLPGTKMRMARRHAEPHIGEILA